MNGRRSATLLSAGMGMMLRRRNMMVAVLLLIAVASTMEVVQCASLDGLQQQDASTSHQLQQRASIRRSDALRNVVERQRQLGKDDDDDSTKKNNDDVNDPGNDDGDTKEASVGSDSTPSPTKADTATSEASTDPPTKTPFVAGDDDPIQDQIQEKEEFQEELEHEEKVARTAGGFGFFFAVGAMIFTAHQMSENPDGIFASVCRLAITICGVGFKLICMPCRKVFGTGGGQQYGHVPIATNDYSYRGHNAAFEMT